jgi:hypothetical protein
MKIKTIFSIILSVACLSVNAQTFHNVFEDTKQLKKIIGASNGKFSSSNYGQWYPIIKKYLPKESQGSYKDMSDVLEDNPFGLSPGELLPLVDSITSLPGFELGAVEVVVIGISRPATGTETLSPYKLSTSAAADALTNLIIERGKEELTVTFFDQLKRQLTKNPELSIAFPKTTAFIDRIESYLFASYLQTLREAFIDDIYNLPFKIGYILRTPRMKLYMANNPKSNEVWLAMPVLQFLGDLRNGKTVADCLKSINPDEELAEINPVYYNFMKLTAGLSESVRDKSGMKDWVSYTDLQGLLSDEVSKSIFFGLLYLNMTQDDRWPRYINNYLTIENEQKVLNILKSFCEGYQSISAPYKVVKSTVMSGKPLNVNELSDMVIASDKEIQKTLDAINDLSSDNNIKVNTELFFKAIPSVLMIINNFQEKKYSAGLMNMMILMDTYIAKDGKLMKPFEKIKLLNVKDLEKEDLKESLYLSLIVLREYSKKISQDNIKDDIAALQKIEKNLSDEPTAEELRQVIKIYSRLSTHEYDFDANDIYQKLLKYGSLMAAISAAENTADVTKALEAAILPVGSSAIKYYTALSFSLNSYIGGAYYKSYYTSPNTAGKPFINTAGVALPIGVNFSLTTRGRIVGAISLFASVIDLGAVASYRLSAPPDVNSQNLPDFTLQNILAPGGFLVLNRLFKTPLAFGLGLQKAPQLSSITYNTIDISKNQTWRFGAFLSVDIPLFNVYSKSLKKPLN